MKKAIFILLTTLSIAACDKVYINGALDGMWKLTSVQYSDSTAYPTQIFYSFQRHLAQVGEYYDEEFPTRFLCELNYNGKQLSMSNFHSFPLELYPATPEMLKTFHLYSNSTVFTIVTLNKETLIMSSEERTYHFSKW